MKKNYHKSYSQCGEDMILSFIFYKALKIKKPTYLDIGAYDSYEDSNTAVFYENGSTGVNVEPNTGRYKKIATSRKRDINLNLGVSTKEGVADFHTLSSEKMSTLIKPKAEKLLTSHKIDIKSTKKIQVTTVNKIIEKYCKGIFPDLFSLDAEGMDLAILRSINWKKYSPLVICTETASYSTNGNEKKDIKLISFLESKGYMVYADTRINTIFIKKDKYINHK